MQDLLDLIGGDGRAIGLDRLAIATQKRQGAGAIVVRLGALGLLGCVLVGGGERLLILAALDVLLREGDAVVVCNGRAM